MHYYKDLGPITISIPAPKKGFFTDVLRTGLLNGIQMEKELHLMYGSAIKTPMRNITIATGAGGLKLFQDALKERYGKKNYPVIKVKWKNEDSKRSVSH